MRTSLLLGLILPAILGRMSGNKDQAPQHPCFWGVAVDGYPITTPKLDKVEQELGFPPQIVLFYLQWPAPAG